MQSIVMSLTVVLLSSHICSAGAVYLNFPQVLQLPQKFTYYAIKYTMQYTCANNHTTVVQIM